MYVCMYVEAPETEVLVRMKRGRPVQERPTLQLSRRPDSRQWRVDQATSTPTQCAPPTHRATDPADPQTEQIHTEQIHTEQIHAADPPTQQIHAEQIHT